jgi:hypothetical protein
MIIYKYDIPDELVYRYCKIIMELEKHYSIIFEKARSEVHNEIFSIAGRSRALDERDDRLFNKALNNMVLDLTYKD